MCFVFMHLPTHFLALNSLIWQRDTEEIVARERSFWAFVLDASCTLSLFSVSMHLCADAMF